MLMDEHNGSAPDGIHNPERISKEDFHSLRIHIVAEVLASLRMSSEAAEEPPPKGQVHVVALHATRLSPRAFL